ncbi:bifunctional (p)ppGpp synthetase/guanosine-3',5'-bis(diphosphate) 3'-pyrophosphohydrolase [Carboxylicivirga mesophila]|uniref:Bifunctional (P)ppGpp synthetase/guanosine-3',5'-bis(Diphosphate) 3'-pyrophosphohydrolase n=1 Tax=Carboxylicivirga mesophila TaxID=1166478 RepID=A0ABS5KEB1_9BACT|nr:RelA/SpoT family protein [Carboxylicivirga mesophila]MBS2213389.1 bifunctional (p)ppGpp synthetase/guanosine-3',5'-bis(diphosphate) 3'-pyrophosphohydrolase [Carboxylicivirga mesophila]
MTKADWEEEDKMIREQFNALIDACPRCQTPENRKLVTKAFELAHEAHMGMRRKSGEPYILHPIEVARIAAEEIGLGTKGVIAAILHDVVEDTDYTVEDLQNIFGEKIASIVAGLTKLEGVFDQSSSIQAENFRKLLLTMVEDVRVILIKLADRLHNMRTLNSMPEHKRLKIAGETLYFYAPLAHRLGLYAIKTELEDLSLKYELPQVFNNLSQKVKDSEEQHVEFINNFKAPIEERLKAEGYEFDVVGRHKSVYSIWSKMQKKDLPFEEIYDVLAIRVVFKPKSHLPEKTQCWAIYSMITDIYKPKPDRLRDWVSTPKANGYEALHSTVMGPDGKWVEIQIRTTRMDEIAERGFAAHWKYKGQKEKESELDKWLEMIKELLDNPDADSLEFLDDFKLNLFASEIMIFTPKGDVKVMPKGATALDFAFDIHTDIGYKCIGAKVNFKLVPLSHQLKSGDQVEIITSEKQQPKYEWLSFVTTAKAKTRIKNAFKEERKSIIAKGERILEQELHKKKLTINSRILKKILDYHKISKRDELYFKIGKGSIKLDDLHKILSTKSRNKWIRYWKLNFGMSTNKPEEVKPEPSKKKTQVVLSDNDEQDQFTIADCCNPIPGDDILAFMDESDQIILHSRKCPVALKLMSSQGNRIVSAQWESHKILSYLALINLSGIDQMGIVSKITKVISEDQNVNMRSINIESHDGIFEGNIYLYIHNTEDLNNLILNIMKIKGVHNVNRQDRIKADL